MTICVDCGEATGGNIIWDSMRRPWCTSCAGLHLGELDPENTGCTHPGLDEIDPFGPPDEMTKETTA